MDNLRIPTGRGPEAGFFKHFAHRDIAGQNVRCQLLQSGSPGEIDEMARQHHAYSLSLIGIDDHERHLGLARSDYYITAAADDRRPTVFVDLRDECDVFDEVDLDKEFFFAVRESMLRRE